MYIRTTLSRETVESVLKQVARRIRDRDVFTAYDITLAVREGTSENIPHAEVREIVHRLYEGDEMGGDYVRTSGPVDFHRTAFYYHPADTHPSLYTDGLLAVMTLLEPAGV